jgi:hypothetical protein
MKFMNNRKKAYSFLLLLLIGFGFVMAGNFLTTPSVEPMTIDEPNSNFVVAAAATSAAISSTENNVTNPRGGDDLLCGAYETYYLILNTSDADAATQILNVTAEFVVSASPGTSIGGFLAVTTGATVVVTELATGAGNVRLGTGSTNATTATTQNITIPFKLEWEMGARTDVDINVTVYEAAASAESQKNANLDFVATLTLSDSTFYTYNEYLNGESYGTSSITYHYTGYTTLYPLNAETDFWVTTTAILSEGVGARSYQSSTYTEGTGVAQFTTLLAPDVNSAVTQTITMIAVDKAGGAADTSLMATTNTDTVTVNPNANTDDRTTRDDNLPGIVPPDFLNSMEGFIIVGAAAVIVLGGAVYVSKQGASTKKRSRSRPKRKKTTKKKSRKKAKRRKRKK